MKFSKSQLMASVCRDSFYYFVKTFWHTVISEVPVWNWHMEFLCDELQKVAERVFANKPKLYDLVINISPGTTKSTIASVMLPCWAWTRMSNTKAICASYSFPLAMDLSRRSRDVVSSELYQDLFPDIILREDQNTKHFFANTKRGYRFSTGLNGTVTGMHGHFIITDDPIDPLQSLSDLELKAANTWIDNTLSTRKVDKEVAVEILIMQRLHQDDPTNLFLQREKVKHICLPAEITDYVKPVECLEFYKDGLMDPNRLSRAVLNREMQKGSYYYSGQFLQNPTPLGGGMFKVGRIHIKKEHPGKFKWVIRYWDKAGTVNTGAYTVGVKMAEDMEGRFWILNVVRVRLESAAREHLMKKVAYDDGHGVVIGMEQEPGSGGKQSVEASGRNLKGYIVRFNRVAKGDGDKEERADPFSVQVNLGNVYMVEEFWNRDYLDELEHFPNSRYKDQVDASSGAFNMGSRKIRVGGMKKWSRDIPNMPSDLAPVAKPEEPLNLPYMRGKK